MDEDSLQGYRGRLKVALKAIGAGIGDFVKVESKNTIYEGSLMPRLESDDEHHIVLKLRNGYNLGVTFNALTRVKRIGEADKPEFSPPPLPSIKKGLPRVSIVSTGGTIASRVDYTTGGVHAAISSRDLLSIVPELSDFAAVEADILYSVFSEDINSRHWTGMATMVLEKVNAGVAGIVITHGTDTLGYSAAALSFSLRNLPVPVILVGSQRSSDRPSSDAATNLVGVVTAAVNAPFAEVVLGMHETTSDTGVVFHRGTKVRKLHTSARYAFQSVNVRPLAKVAEGKVEMFENDYRRRNDGTLKIINGFEEKTGLVKFYPGLQPNLVEWYVDEGYKGLILEGTGLGHVSTRLFEVIDRAIKAGLYVGMTSQCIWGRLNMNVYTTGRMLQRLGVEPLGDMLPETAYVKLMWALANSKDLESAKVLMQKNIAGEYSDRTLYTGRFG